MKKEQELKVIPLEKCSTVDQLESAIKRKEVFIEIANELKEDFLSKTKAASKDKNFFEKLIMGVSLPEVVVYGAFEGMSIPFTAFTWLCYIALMKKISDAAFGDYEISVFEESGDYRFLLIHRKSVKKNDRIVCKEFDLFRFVLSDQTECPKCGKKIKNFSEIRKKGYNPYSCAECGQKLIWSANMADYGNSEIKAEKDRQKMLKKYGINEEKYLAPEGDELSSRETIRRHHIASDNTEELCGKFRTDLKANKFIPEPAIDEQDGRFYDIVKGFYSAPFGTPECDIVIMNTARFINIRSRQIRGIPLDRSEEKDAKYVVQSFELGLPVKIDGKYENALKEAAWFAVISYLCDIFLPPETIRKMIPTDKALYSKWNGFIESMGIVPQEVKDLFILDGDGKCGFIHEIEVRSIRRNTENE